MPSRHWVVGRVPVLECLRARRRVPHRLHILADAKGIESILAAAGDVPVEKHRRGALDALAGGVLNQGVVLETGPLPVHRVDAWVDETLTDDSLLVILDGVVDPHNFGAIVRSAAACGASGVVFAKDRSAPISAVSSKSAAGAMDHIDLVEAGNLVRAMDRLKEAGFWMACLDARAPQPLWEADLTGRIGLVVGSEGKGVRRLVRERCDFHLRIPLTGPITSLNAAVSAGVALAECLRQRCAKEDTHSGKEA